MCTPRMAVCPFLYAVPSPAPVSLDHVSKSLHAGMSLSQAPAFGGNGGENILFPGLGFFFYLMQMREHECYICNISCYSRYKSMLRMN